MGKRTTPPRSFNTIRQSQCKKRTKREANRRFVLLAICAVTVLIVLASLILLICSIVDTVASNAPGSHNPSDVTYQAYTQEADGLERGELILINKQTQYSFPANATTALVDMRDELAFAEGAASYGFASPTEKYLFNRKALTAFNAMMDQYYAVTGDNTLAVRTAYRTKEQQQASGSSTPAGFSDHHSGYCIAFTDAFSKSVSSVWITENCHKFGFITRYPTTKKAVTGVENYTECFRYVGVAHATYIKENKLCLEEYVNLLANNHPFDGDHLQFTGADNNSYSVYYVPISNTPVTTLNVPENFSYTVSGDNRRGFIVTVNLSDPIN